jgi:hypothetical protein
MPNNVRIIPADPEKLERLNQAKARQTEQREQRAGRSREQGQIAWGNFSNPALKVLKVGDRQSIARCLGKLLEEYKVQGSQGELLKGVKFLSRQMIPKDLDRLRIRPGKPFRELDRRPAPYRALIESLAKHTDKELHILADEILLDTSFHPISKVDLDEATLILDALQVAVDRIDQEYKLWEQCKAIAAIREPLEKRYIEAVQSCDDEVAMSEISSQQGDPAIKKWWPLEELLLAPLERPIVPDNPFWISSNPHDPQSKANVVCDESIFFFPHAYLGPAIEWYDGRPDGHVEALRREINSETEPFVRFESEEYRIYIRDPKTGNELANGDDWFMWGDCADGMGETARWLVIYPDHEAQRLVPALFTRGDAWFTELVPLTPRLIAEFGDCTRWQCSDNTPTLLQSLRKLTGFGSGDFKVMKAWRDTAAHFHLNPIFRAHPGKAEKIIYRRNLEKWIKEGQASLNSPPDS